MAITIFPYIPSTITVHLGPPDKWAENVTVSFPDYVKNVASSEIYPTWEPAAIRANVLAIVSFALNRVYTEFYTSRGHSFQITATTAYDQRFIRGRNFFDSISRVVDELFNDYLRRRGYVEPLSAKFCNGTTSTCAGLSQWGSQELAQSGADSMEILHHYYGENVELVVDAPIRDLEQSYPGTPLRLGAAGEEVIVIQASLNRISQNYPAIPKIRPATGSYGPETEAAVRVFQQIFNLTPDGVVGKATWYKLIYLYVGVMRLSELSSIGQTHYTVQYQYPGVLREGDTGGEVQVLQYMLAMLAEFNDGINTLEQDGVYGPSTTRAVQEFQQLAELPPDGVAGEATWDAIYSAFAQIDYVLRRDTVRFPLTASKAVPASLAVSDARSYAETPRVGQYPGHLMYMGQSDWKGAVQV